MSGAGFRAYENGCNYAIRYIGSLDLVRGDLPVYLHRRLNGDFTFIEDIHRASFFPDEKDALLVLSVAVDKWNGLYSESDFTILSPDEVLVALIMED